MLVPIDNDVCFYGESLSGDYSEQTMDIAAFSMPATPRPPRQWSRPILEWQRTQ